jgi:hypothetical protein
VIWTSKSRRSGHLTRNAERPGEKSPGLFVSIELTKFLAGNTGDMTENPNSRALGQFLIGCVHFRPKDLDCAFSGFESQFERLGVRLLKKSQQSKALIFNLKTACTIFLATRQHPSKFLQVPNIGIWTLGRE